MSCGGLTLASTEKDVDDKIAAPSLVGIAVRLAGEIEVRRKSRTPMREVGGANERLSSKVKGCWVVREGSNVTTEGPATSALPGPCDA